MYSVLQNKSNIQLRTNPFPYFIIDNALPEDLYNKLDKEFPKFEKIIKNDLGTNEYKENTAYRYNASRSLVDNDISEDWKNFISYHTSSEFTDELFDIFAEPISKSLPWLSKGQKSFLFST